MFLNRLSEKEKRSFLKIALLVATADNEFDKKEQQVFEDYLIEMNIEEMNIEEEIDLRKELSNFDSLQSVKILLLEIFAMVEANGEFKTEEKQVIDVIIEYFDLDDSLIMLCYNWVEMLMLLGEQGKAIIGLEV